MKNNINPPFLFKLFILLMVISIFLPLEKSIPLPYNLLGVILLFTGAYIAVKAKRRFQRTWTPMPPSAKPIKLHTCGLFSYTRNPMYLGIVIGLSGIAIMTGIIYNLIFPVLYLVIMDRVFIKIEEHNLEKEFEEEYILYKNKVRRWI
ncbi:MAG: isoprenylcysteine carboxylmethyltransferase family protein [Ignavibacteriaceae bacterium]